MKANVKEILKSWLLDNGFDGLYNSDIHCGCDVNDLNPCDDCAMECKPAYKVKCSLECKNPCDSFGDSGADCYTTIKPASKQQEPTQ